MSDTTSKISRRLPSLFVGFLGILAHAVFAVPLQVVDLASSTAWTASVAGGASRPIIVPGAGWNSDKQNPRIDKDADNVLYQRSIAIPTVIAGQITKIRFGSVNHGADVFIDDKLVLNHIGPNMPFEADITPFVTSGNTYTLKVKAYSYNGHYKDGVPLGEIKHCNWMSEGIAKYIRMEFYPPIYIKNVFVKPSVTNKQLVYDVLIHNGTAATASLGLNGKLSSWNNDPWVYPLIATQTVTVAAGEDAKVTVSVPWNLGPTSYWWPNIPFRENYLTRLHNLSLSVTNNAAVADSLTQRFGFVQWGEGPYYYTVNGVRLGSLASNSTQEPTMSYDCYSTLPAYLPPHGPNTGFPETLRKYGRLGIFMNRMHSSTPTDYMLQVSDEQGAIMECEIPPRGWDQSRFDSASFTQSAKDLAMFARNSPSVAFYSDCNECASFVSAHQQGILIDAFYNTDGTRPIIAEDDHSNTNPGPGLYKGNTTAGHAYRTQHYQDYRNWPSKTMITMNGEYCDKSQPKPYPCTATGIGREADLGLDMRLRDVAYWAIWHVVGWWPNFLEGGSDALGASGDSRLQGADRVDGPNGNGWGSPEVTFVTRHLDPYIVVDKEIQAANICFSNPWPATIPSYAAGATINRNLEIFNGGFSGDSLMVLWEARWDSPTGKVAASGSTGMVAVLPGFHVTKAISFPAPSTTATADTVPITKGAVMSKEDRVYYNVGGSKLYVIYKSVLPTAPITTNLLRQFDAAPWQGLQPMSGSMLTIPSGKYRLAVLDAQGKTLLRESGVGPKNMDMCRVGSGMRFFELSTEKEHAMKTIMGVMR
jgi:hypothetical protein